MTDKLFRRRLEGLHLTLRILCLCTINIRTIVWWRFEDDDDELHLYSAFFILICSNALYIKYYRGVGSRETGGERGPAILNIGGLKCLSVPLKNRSYRHKTDKSIGK